jgi:hypothetical protein
MIAAYDLRHFSASFEFFYWLVLVKALGATRIFIDASRPKTSKMSINEIKARIYNTLIPGCALAGLSGKIKYKFPVRGDMTHSITDFRKWFMSGGKFERLQSVKEPADCRYTVTIRNHTIATNRNSNETAWRQFAEEIGAVVIEDYYVKPIDLHDRMALYAGAKMNFGVCNGPVALLSLTPYPMKMFVPTQSARNSQVKAGNELEAERFPWMLPSQRLIWREDTIENLRETVDAVAV